jgi:hypothetical protein
MSSGLLQGMDRAELLQDIASTKQDRLNSQQDRLRNKAEIKGSQKKIKGYIVEMVGLAAATLGSLIMLIDKKFDTKPKILAGSLYALVTLGALGYGLDSIFCKVYENKVKNTFEVHGLYTRIKDAMYQFRLWI